VNDPAKALLLDIDGTLVDSNDAHAHAWVQAFVEAGVQVAFSDVRRAIGMGGDKLMPAVAGIEEDTPLGKHIADRRHDIFASDYLPRLKAFPGAGDLVRAVLARGVAAVAASSAKRDELEALLRIADAMSLLSGSASSDDADESKPDPDIVHAALANTGASAGDAVMIGDTPYDVEAATKAGVAVIAFRCGGWNDQSLRGAVAIYDGPWDLLEHLETSPIIAHEQLRHP
jgi:HAD superfamily hydrolase (TIGR01509 family)